MRSSRRIAIGVMVIAMSFTGLYGQSAKTPEERVKSFYSWYLKSINNGPDPDKSKPVMNSHLSKRLSLWYWSKAGRAQEADYFIQRQEWSEEWADHITIGKSTTKGTTAVVKLVLGSADGGWDKPLTISLVKEAGTWKIDRVATGSATAQPTAKRPALPNNLTSYVGQYPAKLMKVASVKSRLKALLGKSYAYFSDSIFVQSEISKQGDFLLASGCMAHMCSSNGAAFVIDLGNNRFMRLSSMRMQTRSFSNEDKVPTPQILLDWMADR